MLLQVLVLLIGGAQAPPAQNDLGDAEREQAQKKLESYLLNKKLVSKITFPASKDGVEVMIDGTWNQRRATRLIKDAGVGVEIGESVNVTAVSVKGKHLEIHLNGGGYGTSGDIFLSSQSKRNARRAGTGKAPGGSRINLRFDRPVTLADIDDVNALMGYLDPVADCSALRQVAALKSLPEAFKSAASRGEIVNGMDKTTVFAILGEAKIRNADVSGAAPVEKWQYELKDFKTRIVTFTAGKVTQVTEF